MRRLYAAAIWIACLLASSASSAASAMVPPHPPVPGLCLSSGEEWEVVSARKVIPPGRAVHMAHKLVPNGDVLRAALCREQEGLVYRIVVLRKDGRIVHVTIEAPSGKVKMVQ